MGVGRPAHSIILLLIILPRSSPDADPAAPELLPTHLVRRRVMQARPSHFRLHFRLAVSGPNRRQKGPMNNQLSQPSQLPDYISSAKPNPPANRAPWFKNTAPTYAGIFLWFVFWQEAVNFPNAGGGLASGLGVALFGLLLSALICHLLFYLVPGLLGQRTGLPLYIVGTSTFGATGGFIMPGFLMGLLQFGWLGVNIYFSSLALADFIPVPANIIMIVWGVLAAFVG